jgi:hypothetical protein
VADVLIWRDRELSALVARTSEANMKRACAFLRSAIRRSLAKPNPDGRSPSLPGQPPRRISGALRDAIIFAVERDGRDIVGGIGVAKGRALHASDLELGNPSLHLEPRPFLRPALLKNRRQLARLLAGQGLGGRQR